MAGTATLIANKQFDINTTTLNQFADLYVAEANLKDPQVWAAEFRRNPLFKDSLKMTVGEYMDTISKGTNPYVVLYDEVSDRFIDEGFKGKELADKISNALTDIRSKLQVLEDNHNNNVIVKRLDKEQVFAV